MEEQSVKALEKIHNYEEYLRRFFPNLEQSMPTKQITPQEIGLQMARDTLDKIREALSRDKTA